MADGQYFVNFEAKGLESGVYHCVIKTNEQVESRQLLLMNKGNTFKFKG